MRGDDEWTGTIPLPRLMSLRNGGALTLGAVATGPGATTFFADVNLDGKLTDDDRIVFRPSEDCAYSSYSILKVQLPGPPARLFGVAVFVPRAEGNEPAPRLAYAMTARVLGSITLEGHEIAVRLPFDSSLKKLSISPATWGWTRTATGTLTTGRFQPNTPTFPTACQFPRRHPLRVFRRADYSTGQFALRQHPASDNNGRI